MADPEPIRVVGPVVHGMECYDAWRDHLPCPHEQPADASRPMSTSAPIGPSTPWRQWPTWTGPSYVFQQGCADGFHAWVPWLRLDNGSYVTWCAREGCNHHEQYDAPGGSS